MLELKTLIIKFGYKNLIKPVFFKLDPENVHDRMSNLGRLLSKSSLTKKITGALFKYRHPALEQNVLGIHFPNPIGLSAGFDKNAELTDILPEVGFGFAEVGSITGEYCEGNPKPRLWRLKESQSLQVYYGLKNDGSETISKRLTGKNFNIPIGISVAKTNSVKTVDLHLGVADYVKAFQAFANIGAYTTLNISCPNAFGGQPFTDPQSLERLLSEIDKIQTNKPTFIKLSPDLNTEQLDLILEGCDKHKIKGIICSNLTKNFDNAKIRDPIVGKGGISGKVDEDLANKQLEYVYKKTHGRYVLVGCGGVFSAEDAYKKIRAGATLVQMITGMIFEGPQIVGEINKGLVELLKRDGYKNISEAVGKEY